MFVMENYTPAQQFCFDYLMVADNDFEMYQDLVEKARICSLRELSEDMQNEYECLAEQVCELVEEKISPTASLLMAQLLKGWGSKPFDLIAGQLKERVGE